MSHRIAVMTEGGSAGMLHQAEATQEKVMHCHVAAGRKNPDDAAELGLADAPPDGNDLGSGNATADGKVEDR